MNVQMINIVELIDSKKGHKLQKWQTNKEETIKKKLVKMYLLEVV